MITKEAELKVISKVKSLKEGDIVYKAGYDKKVYPFVITSVYLYTRGTIILGAPIYVRPLDDEKAKHIYLQISTADPISWWDEKSNCYFFLDKEAAIEDTKRFIEVK